MENLATESFSYSWLDKPPPPAHWQALIEDGNASFRFHVASLPISDDLVNAGEIFSEGQIMPVYAHRPATEKNASVAASMVNPSFLAARGRTKPHYIMRRWRRSSKKILVKCLGYFLNSTCSRKSSRVDDLQRKVLQVGSFSTNTTSLEASPKNSSATACSLLELAHFDNLGYTFDFEDKLGFHPLKIDKNWRNSPAIAPCGYPTYVCCDDDDSSIREAILYCKRSQ